MVVVRPRANVHSGERGKGDGRQGEIGRDGKAGPLEDLSKKVGPGHELKETAARDFVTGLSRFIIGVI